MTAESEIESLFKKMLKDYEDRPQKDEIYQVDVRDFGVLKVQWKICGIEGYQIFEDDKISYKFGEKIDDPDIILTIRNKDLALEFLRGDTFKFTFGAGHKGSFKLYKTVGWKIIDTDMGKKRSRITKPFLTAYFNQKKDFQKEAHQIHCSHEHNEPSSYEVTFADALERKRFIEAIQTLPDWVFRIKGVIEFSDAEKPLLFQYVGGRFEFS